MAAAAAPQPLISGVFFGTSEANTARDDHDDDTIVVNPQRLSFSVGPASPLSEEAAKGVYTDVAVQPIDRARRGDMPMALWRCDHILTDFLVAICGSRRAVPPNDFRQNPLMFADFIYEEGTAGRKGAPERFWCHRRETETSTDGKEQTLDVWRTPDNTVISSDSFPVRWFYMLGGHSHFPDVVTVEMEVNTIACETSDSAIDVELGIEVTTRWYDPTFHSPEFEKSRGLAVFTRSIPYITLDNFNRVTEARANNMGTDFDAGAGESLFSRDRHSGCAVLSADGDPPGVLCHRQSFQRKMKAAFARDGKSSIRDFPFDSLDFDIDIRLPGAATRGDADCSRVLVPLDFQVKLRDATPPNWQFLPIRVSNTSDGARGYEQHVTATISMQRKPQFFIRRVFVPFIIMTSMAFLAFPFNLHTNEKGGASTTASSTEFTSETQDPDAYENRIETVLLVLFTLITYQQSFSADHHPVVPFLTNADRFAAACLGVCCFVMLESITFFLADDLIVAFVSLVVKLQTIDYLYIWCWLCIGLTIMLPLVIQGDEHDSLIKYFMWGTFVLGTVSVLESVGTTWKSVIGTDRLAAKVDKIVGLALFSAWVIYSLQFWWQLQAARLRTRRESSDWEADARQAPNRNCELKGTKNNTNFLYDGHSSTIRRRWLQALKAFEEIVNYEIKRQGKSGDTSDTSDRSFPNIPIIKSPEAYIYSPKRPCHCEVCQTRRGLRSEAAEEMRSFLAKSDIAQMSGPIAEILGSAGITVKYLRQVFGDGKGAADLTTVLKQAGVVARSHAVKITIAIADAVEIERDFQKHDDEVEKRRQIESHPHDADDDTSDADDVVIFRPCTFLALQGSPSYLFKFLGVHGRVMPMKSLKQRLNAYLSIMIAEFTTMKVGNSSFDRSLETLSNLVMAMEIFCTELGDADYVFAMRTFTGDERYFGDECVCLHTQLWSGYLASLPIQAWPQSTGLDVGPLALIIEIGSGSIKHRVARHKRPIKEFKDMGAVVTQHVVEDNDPDFNVYASDFFTVLRTMVQSLEAPHHFGPHVSVEVGRDDKAVRFKFQGGNCELASGEDYFMHSPVSMKDLYSTLGLEAAIQHLLGDTSQIHNLNHVFLIGTGNLRKMREEHNRMPDGNIAVRPGNRFDEILAALGEYCRWKLEAHFGKQCYLNTHVLSGEEESKFENLAYVKALQFAAKPPNFSLSRRRPRRSRSMAPEQRSQAESRFNSAPSACGAHTLELVFDDVPEARREHVQKSLWSLEGLSTCGWGHGTCQYSLSKETKTRVSGPREHRELSRSLGVGLTRIQTEFRESGLNEITMAAGVDETKVRTIVQEVRHEVRQMIRSEAPFLRVGGRSSRSRVSGHF
mmetsp:Transcript_4936/g.14913  ORF Transcript_4936/g.14913 Transcript_4936/m.14913 type:complete len:1357 (+) Transcript_4936:99-4169(+)|eukprot:CAMPEP_0206286798 /NCGR_PEP_ID=MMETSP0106_2-20121207/785_1 /ASSEMBLY_ACC=CAM_ASM_000206 /TAXON_ID=81532 /ORGANISM="Acanthoeca-like sp., Strain 10tr" /LENGTH=1356 /DNA_ID=CAMNT_0053717329 /DNA_START=48 /DNA_END=4118 /DNA_ORIENTATION=-